MSDETAKLIKRVQTKRRDIPTLRDDDLWRDVVEQVAGKRSLRELDVAGLEAVLAHLRHLAPDKPRTPDASGHGLPYTPTRQLALIRVKWIEGAKEGWITNRKDAALTEFIRGRTGQHIGALTNHNVDLCLAALKAMRDRHLGKGADLLDGAVDG